GPGPEVLVERVRVDDLARVHAPVGVPRRLELPERLHDLAAEHPRQELAPRLAIAVLARERAAVRDDEVGALLHERPEAGHAFDGLQVEGAAHVDAPLAEVAVHGVPVPVPLQERAQVAEVGAEPVRRDRGVLPRGPRVLDPGDAARAHARLTDLPDPLLPCPVVDHLPPAPAVRAPAQALHDLVRAAGGLGARLAAELDHEPRAPRREQLRAGQALALALHVVDDVAVERLERDRAVLHDAGHLVRTRRQVRVPDDEQRATRRAGDQPDLRAEDEDARALRTHQRPGEV